MENNLLENAKLDEALSMFVQGIMDLKEAGTPMSELREVAAAFASGIRRFALECLVDDLEVSLESLIDEPGDDDEEGTEI